MRCYMISMKTENEHVRICCDSATNEFSGSKMKCTVK